MVGVFGPPGKQVVKLVSYWLAGWRRPWFPYHHDPPSAVRRSCSNISMLHTDRKCCRLGVETKRVFKRVFKMVFKRVFKKLYPLALLPKNALANRMESSPSRLHMMASCGQFRRFTKLLPLLLWVSCLIVSYMMCWHVLLAHFCTVFTCSTVDLQANVDKKGKHRSCSTKWFFDRPWTKAPRMSMWTWLWILTSFETRRMMG